MLITTDSNRLIARQYRKFSIHLMRFIIAVNSIQEEYCFFFSRFRFEHKLFSLFVKRLRRAARVLSVKWSAIFPTLFSKCPPTESVYYLIIISVSLLHRFSFLIQTFIHNSSQIYLPLTIFLLFANRFAI